MNSRINSLFILSITACLVMVGHTAWAQETTESDGQGPEESQVDEAREHISRAESLYASRDWEGALVEFQRAYELLEGHDAQHLFLYNIGRCYEHLFRYGQAMSFYRRYLDRAGPDAEDRAEVEAKVELLEGLLATLHLEVDLEQYEVWVDERNIGASLSEIMVPGGSHVVEIRAEGHVPARQEVRVPARDERTLTFTLERLAEEYRGINQGYFWAFTALTVVAAITGIALGVVAMNEHDRVSTQARDEVRRWDLTQDDVDHITHLALGADLLYGTAGLFAVTAVVLAFLTDWGGRREEAPRQAPEGEASSRLRVAPSLGPGLAGLGLEGSF